MSGDRVARSLHDVTGQPISIIFGNSGQTSGRVTKSKFFKNLWIGGDGPPRPFHKHFTSALMCLRSLGPQSSIVRHALDEVEGTFVLFGSSSFARRCDHLFLQVSNDTNGGTLWVLDYGKASHFGNIPRL